MSLYVDFSFSSLWYTNNFPPLTNSYLERQTYYNSLFENQENETSMYFNYDDDFINDTNEEIIENNYLQIQKDYDYTYLVSETDSDSDY